MPSTETVQAIDSNSNVPINLSVGDELRFVRVEPGDDGSGVAVVCEDGTGRHIKFPSTSQVKVSQPTLQSKPQQQSFVGPQKIKAGQSVLGRADRETHGLFL